MLNCKYCNAIYDSTILLSNHEELCWEIHKGYNNKDLMKRDSAPVHPLLNPDSKHYSMVDGVEAISRMEAMYPDHELMVWAKITAMKYRLRIGNKDDVTKEAKKIETYEAYYTYLKDRCQK